MLDRASRRRPDASARRLAPSSVGPVATPRLTAPAAYVKASLRPPPTLAIADAGALPRGLLDAATGAQVVVAGFDALDAALLLRHRPVLVLSRALSRRFDALDLALRLVDLGYRGRYLALAEALPSPDLVRAEVACACPSLDFAVHLTRPPARRPEPALLRAL